MGDGSEMGKVVQTTENEGDGVREDGGWGGGWFGDGERWFKPFKVKVTGGRVGWEGVLGLEMVRRWGMVVQTTENEGCGEVGEGGGDTEGRRLVGVEM